MELFICIKMDLSLNDQQRLIYHKTQTTSTNSSSSSSSSSSIVTVDNDYGFGVSS